MTARRKLPPTRQSITHKVEIETASGPREYYIIVGLYADGKPGEVFAKEGRNDTPMLDQFCRALSILLQDGHDTTDLVRKFGYARYEPAGYTDCKLVKQAYSITDYIVRWMDRYFNQDAAQDAPQSHKAGK